MAELALTFDDGPDPVWTPRLLDVLAEGRAQATFFVIAGRAVGCPELIARMQREGHTIGLHCDQHVRHSRRTPLWVARDTRRALDRLAGIGVSPALWRTPWGEIAPWSRRIAREHELKLVGWDVDTHDWRGDRADEILTATRDALRDGSVVLAHDGIGPGARRDDAAETIAYTRLLIADAGARDLQLTPMG